MDYRLSTIFWLLLPFFPTEQTMANLPNVVQPITALRKGSGRYISHNKEPRHIQQPKTAMNIPTRSTIDGTPLPIDSDPNLRLKNPEVNIFHPYTSQPDSDEEEPKCSKNSMNLGSVVIGLLENYDSHMLPQGKTVDTVVEIHIQEVSSISELTQDFEMDIMYSEIWKEPRLSFANISGMTCVQNITLEKVFREKLWNPDTCIVNSKNTMIHKSPSDNVFMILSRDGMVWSNYRMKVRGPCRLDMFMFPFDLIKCHLYFESYSFNSDEVHLLWHQVPVTFMDVVDLPEFHVVGWRKDYRRLPYPNGIWDRLELTIVFKRRFGAYLVQAYFPTTLTVLSAWVGLLLDARTISARTTLGISSLLAMVLQFGNLLRQLPRVSYIKCLDVWMIACVVCIFVTLVELALVYQLSLIEKEKEQAKLVIGQWLKVTKKKRHVKGALGKQGTIRVKSDDKSNSEKNNSTVDQNENMQNRSGPDLSSWRRPSHILARSSCGYIAVETSYLLDQRSLCTDANCEWNDLLTMESQSCPRRLGKWSRKRLNRLKLWIQNKWRKFREIGMTATNLDRLAMVGFPFLFVVFNSVYWGYYIPRIEDGSNMGLLDPVYVGEE